MGGHDKTKALNQHRRGTSMLVMRGEGRTTREIAATYGVSEDWVKGIIRRTVKALGATDALHALAILLVTDPELVDHLRRELSVSDEVRELLREL